MFGNKKEGIPPIRELYLWPKDEETRRHFRNMGYASSKREVPFGNHRRMTTVFRCSNRETIAMLQRSRYLRFRALSCFKSFDEKGRSRSSPLKYYRGTHVGLGRLRLGGIPVFRSFTTASV